MNDAGKVAFTPKGAYNNTVTYEYLDTVVYDGNSYAALKTTTGNTPTDDSEYWKLLVRGGSSVPIATEDINGVVKASEDIGVDSNAKMVLKTDYTEQTELTEIESGETRKTFFGKIAKAISTLVNHININATSAKAGHVKLSNSSAVTDSTGLALPATEKNASIDGTLANRIAEIKGFDLVWANNGSNFNATDSYNGGQVIGVPEKYDAFIIMSTDGTLTSILNIVDVSSHITTVLNVDKTIYALFWAQRKISIVYSPAPTGQEGGSSRGIFFDPCYYRPYSAGGQFTLSNACCVPFRIYGVKR